MTGPDPEQGERDDPPSWMGAPGYTPHPELPPHAPMPGAPPYPPAVDHPPPPVGEPALRTRFRAALGASALAAAALVVLVVLVEGPPPGAAGWAALVGSAAFAGLLTATVVWAAVRRRAWPFWALLLVAVPVVLVLRAFIRVG
ncbi:MAG: hypothetical protein NTW05_23540 [Pseudonocardiales bacterium]|jgi:hypothetical protein|nr:hypothetical protein [Pseudonocardiales bacterium]